MPRVKPQKGWFWDGLNAFLLFEPFAYAMVILGVLVIFIGISFKPRIIFGEMRGSADGRCMVGGYGRRRTAAFEARTFSKMTPRPLAPRRRRISTSR